jgi:hypothetical protein
MDRSKFQGHDDDHKTLVFMLLDEVKPRYNVRRVIHAAYEAGYERKSDGITLMPELEFCSFKMKNPCGVGHDWLYFMGMQNPFLYDDIKTERAARMWCDQWFRDALIDFGHPIRARIYFVGLRIGGWRAWNIHRKKGNPQ